MLYPWCITPLPASHQGESTKRRKLKKKQNSLSVPEGDGSALLARTKEYVRQQWVSIGTVVGEQ